MAAASTQLELLGIAEGTDKTFLGNDYLRHYARIFAEYRDLPINVLEIGVANGGSLRTWRRYFSKATIIGVDIQPQCLQYAEDRIVVEIGSQADESFLTDLARRYEPQIIIDDGSHKSSHQIISLECLFSLLPPGGIYVIEDTFFQANPATAEYGDSSPLAIDYILAIGRDRIGWKVDDPVAERRRELVERYVERVELFHGCAALFKHGASREKKALLEMACKAAAESANDEVWFHLFRFALQHPADKIVAELAATKAYENTGDLVLYTSRMELIRVAN